MAAPYRNIVTAQFPKKSFVQALKQAGCIFREKAKTGVPGEARGTLRFIEHGLELWSYSGDGEAIAFIFIDGRVPAGLIGEQKTFLLQKLYKIVQKSRGPVSITSKTHPYDSTLKHWEFQDQTVTSYFKEYDTPRPDIAPPERSTRFLEQAVFVDAWRTDPSAEPGPGFEWERESEYLPAHWSRV